MATHHHPQEPVRVWHATPAAPDFPPRSPLARPGERPLRRGRVLAEAGQIERGFYPDGQPAYERVSVQRSYSDRSRTGELVGGVVGCLALAVSTVGLVASLIVGLVAVGILGGIAVIGGAILGEAFQMPGGAVTGQWIGLAIAVFILLVVLMPSDNR